MPQSTVAMLPYNTRIIPYFLGIVKNKARLLFGLQRNICSIPGLSKTGNFFDILHKSCAKLHVFCEYVTIL